VCQDSALERAPVAVSTLTLTVEACTVRRALNETVRVSTAVARMSKSQYEQSASPNEIDRTREESQAPFPGLCSRIHRSIAKVSRPSRWSSLTCHAIVQPLWRDQIRSKMRSKRIPVLRTWQRPRNHLEYLHGSTVERPTTNGTTTAASSLRRWEAYFRSVIAVNSTHLHSAAPNVHRASHSSPMVPSQPTSRPSSHNAPDLMRRRLNRNSVGIRANCFRMST